ncbi:unnamed protein product [Rhodiola kirilowii]
MALTSLIPTKLSFADSPSTAFNNRRSVASVDRIIAVHISDPAKSASSVSAKAMAAAPSSVTISNQPPPSKVVDSGKWSIESWKTKKALQLPEYPDKEELESVLKTLEAFPPIVFAGEASSLEEKLGEAAMGNAFLLQGGDRAESFKEFNAINIRDTFRILLQMGVVLMFGGHIPVIKVKGLFFINGICGCCSFCSPWIVSEALNSDKNLGFYLSHELSVAFLIQHFTQVGVCRNA